MNISSTDNVLHYSPHSAMLLNDLFVSCILIFDSSAFEAWRGKDKDLLSGLLCDACLLGTQNLQKICISNSILSEYT